MKNIMAVVLIGIAVLGLFAGGVSGEINYFPEDDSYGNVTIPEFVNYTFGKVAAPDIYINETGFGRGVAKINAKNHSRLISVWATPNIYELEPVQPGECRSRIDLSKKSDMVNITVGKDGQYMSFGFGEHANFSMGISPAWNQTLEIYVESKEPIWCCFEIFGIIEKGMIWKDGRWEIDNPNQKPEYVRLAAVGPEGFFNPLPADDEADPTGGE